MLIVFVFSSIQIRILFLYPIIIYKISFFFSLVFPKTVYVVNIKVLDEFILKKILVVFNCFFLHLKMSFPVLPTMLLSLFKKASKKVFICLLVIMIRVFGVVLLYLSFRRYNISCLYSTILLFLRNDSLISIFS